MGINIVLVMRFTCLSAGLIETTQEVCMKYIDQLGEWRNVLPKEGLAYGISLAERADDLRCNDERVFPSGEDIFKAYYLTPPQSVRCVIIGQDPYHGEGQAHGLAFSVKEGTALPPSLRNIFKELSDDLGIQLPESGDLSAWAKRGVFLLNSVLTVSAGEAGSHSAWGWNRFTAATLKACTEMQQPIVYLLWGAQAKKAAKEAGISETQKNVIYSPHPSPLSSYRGFFGSKPFSRTNEILLEAGTAPIDWSLC